MRERADSVHKSFMNDLYCNLVLSDKGTHVDIELKQPPTLTWLLHKNSVSPSFFLKSNLNNYFKLYHNHITLDTPESTKENTTSCFLVMTLFTVPLYAHMNTHKPACYIFGTTRPVLILRGQKATDSFVPPKLVLHGRQQKMRFQPTFWIILPHVWLYKLPVLYWGHQHHKGLTHSCIAHTDVRSEREVETTSVSQMGPL